MKNKLKSGYQAALPSLISILVGLVIAVVILIATNPANALDGFFRMIKGPFNYGAARGLGNMLFYATPILMTGLSVAFAFKTGLFNIGASGQFMIGSLVSVYIAIKWTFIPTSVLWLVALLLGALAGALWAAVVGILKAWRNVNEVITSIMMNYIAMYLVMHVIRFGGIYNQARNETMKVASQIPTFGLDKIFVRSFIDGGILIALICAVIIYVVLEKTTFGYELKAVGLNRDAAKYAGVNEKRAIVTSMIIAGALAGLGGGLTYLAGTSKSINVAAVIASEGFDGIAVALLGMSHPFGVVFSAFFISYLKLGGQAMQVIGYVPEIVEMMIGIILYVSALSLLFRRIITKFKERRLKKVGEES
ncbi:ABC transporter permease [Erysipelothrix larvae]|uniref:ABC transporter permease n=1 Tax=Erysipelothrix larvae TaxID=1514105 RepID=A0A0X8GYU0_9FIRM|nr:ABC transporter permease [Erysipelothrix larvae]AMC92931.1 ABC transporter permease [Erysipelothrix larvae]